MYEYFLDDFASGGVGLPDRRRRCNKNIRNDARRRVARRRRLPTIINSYDIVFYVTAGQDE